MGQSGYGAGRRDDDRSLDYQSRYQDWPRGSDRDRQVFGTDDRFTGRGGPDEYPRYRDRYYTDQSIGNLGREDPSVRKDMQMGRGNYDHREDNRSFRSRDYGPSESERGTWSQQMTRPGPHRGKGPRGYTKSDERIKDHVCEELSDDSMIDASGIDVEVRDGEVTLSGMVPDRQMKRWAEDLVAEVGGVRDVINQMRVSDDERQKLGRSHQSGNQNGNGQGGPKARA